MTATILLAFWEQFGLNEAALLVFRVAAGVGGAFIGWFAAGPLTRMTYRIAAHKPTPLWLLPWGKSGGAALLGFLAFYFVPLGGSGGLGYGPGLGGNPGKGPGEGGKNAVVDLGSAGDKKSATPPDKEKNVEPAPGKPTDAKTETVQLEIEMIDRQHYRQDDRFYLVGRKEPALALAGVKEYLDKLKDKRVEVFIVLTDESVDRDHEAVLALCGEFEKYKKNITYNFLRESTPTLAKPKQP